MLAATNTWASQGWIADSRPSKLEAALQVLFAGSHPYELPQFLFVTMKASPAYGQWVRTETTVPDPLRPR